MSGKRVALFFIFVGAFSAVFQAGSMAKVSDEEAAMFMDEFEELIKDIDGVGIFMHNTSLALLMFLPGFGVAWGMFAAASTGYAFAAIVQLAPELAAVPPLAILYLTPFGIMELAAYSLATSRSCLLIAAIIKKTGLRQQARGTAIEVGMVLALLFAGGMIEYYMIELASDEPMFLRGL